MALPAWSWPLSGSTARSVELAPFRSGIVAADWLTPTLWPYNGTAFTNGVVLASDTPGLAGVAADASSGVWTVAWDGRLWHQPASGVATSGVMPAGPVYVGCAFAGSQPYVMASSGTVLTSAAVVLGTWPTSGFALAGSGSMLSAVLPASGVGTMTTAGVTGLIALPAGMTVPSCLSLSAGTPVAVGGWQTAPALSGATAAALSPVDPTVMLATGTGRALLWRAASGLTDAWSQSQALTGLASLTNLCWCADGFHALAVSPSSGVVQSIAYATGVISLSQTLTVSGAAAIAVAGDSLHAVVAQSGQSQLATLINTGTWATGSPVTGTPGITTVIPYGASGAVAAYTSGLAFMTLATGGWSITNRVTLSYTPTVLGQDPFGSVYAAGSGLLSVVSTSGAAIVASGSWTGAAPTGLAVKQGRLVLAVPSDSRLYEFGNDVPGLWSLQSSGVLAAGTPVGLGLSQTTLFVMGSASTTMLGYSGTPFVLTNPVSGIAAQRIGGVWVTTVLGVGHTPSAIGYDTGGNLRVATTQNTIWNINSAGTVVSSGIIPQIAQQAQTVPLGVSSLLAFASGMYCGTSMPGVLVSIA